MDMTTDPGGRIDYADYSHESIRFRASNNGSGNAANSQTAHEVEPLAGRGGLDVNEVAELVALDYYVDTAADQYADLDTSNTLPGALQTRGVIGVNLNSKREFVEDATRTPTGDVTELLDSQSVVANNWVQTEPAILDHWSLSHYPAFGDGSTGVGGAGGSTIYSQRMNFRDWLGAGPVLDPNDSFSALIQNVKDQVDLTHEVTVNCRLVWDVAQIDDARTKFGIPE